MIEPIARSTAAVLVLLALLAAAGDRASADPQRRMHQRADSTWRQHDAAADSAAARNDWRAYRHHAARLRDLMHGHPGALLALARADAQLGDTAAALGWVRAYAAAGLVRNMSADSALAPLHGTAGWRESIERIDRNRTAVHRAALAMLIPDTLVIAEYISPAAAGRWLVSSVHQSRIFSVAPDQPLREVMRASPDEPGGFFALARGTRGQALWTTTANLAQVAGFAPENASRTALLSVDASSGRVLRRYPAPADGEPHFFGDIGVLANGDVVVSDDRDLRAGAVFVLRNGADSLTTLVPTGTFENPQQPAPAPDGRRVFVPDYLLGIAIVDATTGSVDWLAHEDSVALNGIDGLIFAPPRSLIAVQNGTSPRRVLRLDLDEPMRRVVSARVLEAATDADLTHGVLVDGEFWFIARSGWDEMTNDGKLRDGVRPERPMIMRLPIR
jgi:hypothetical protein